MVSEVNKNTHHKEVHIYIRIQGFSQKNDGVKIDFRQKMLCCTYIDFVNFDISHLIQSSNVKIHK